MIENEPPDADTAASPAGSLWPELLAITIGGALGSLARFGVGVILAPLSAGSSGAWPLGTLAVNLVGAFVLAYLVAAIAARGDDSGRRRRLRLFLGTGVLGGFTTYSLLSVEVAQLFLRQDWLTGALYALVTVGGGALASLLGVLAASRASPGRGSDLA